MIVLDASALLAYLFAEAGHARVAAELHRAVVSHVNLAEVLTRFARDGHDVAQVHARLRASTIAWAEFDGRQAELCATLARKTQHLGLSLGDRACLALAMSRE